MRKVMTDNADGDATIWITEFGYSVHGSGPEADEHPRSAGVSEKLRPTTASARP
ncbi:MAG: hypothetical protein ICV64_04110 [Thermoleophilia bacterium]|nr:hypothetical protein [Thermoleophilia bacterium]